MGYNIDRICHLRGLSVATESARANFPTGGIMTTHHNKNSLSMRILVAYKVIYGLFLGAAGLGIFHLLNKDLGVEIGHFVATLHLDQENHIMKMLLQVAGFDHRQLAAIGAGTLFYAILEIIEGWGLYGGYSWAKYLTIIATAAFLGPEGYEIIEKLSWVRGALFAVNLGVVFYLIYHLKNQPRHQQR